jgi:hypothetical protein
MPTVDNQCLAASALDCSTVLTHLYSQHLNFGVLEGATKH